PELGLPEPDEPETSPRRVVGRALTWRRDQRGKMHYDDYRRQGLPITRSRMESVVTQVNRRGKGTEKFLAEAGGQALPQLRANQLRDDQPLQAFWQRRQEAATGQCRYRSVAGLQTVSCARPHREKVRPGRRIGGGRDKFLTARGQHNRPGEAHELRR